MGVVGRVGAVRVRAEVRLAVRCGSVQPPPVGAAADDLLLHRGRLGVPRRAVEAQHAQREVRAAPPPTPGRRRRTGCSVTPSTAGPSRTSRFAKPWTNPRVSRVSARPSRTSFSGRLAATCQRTVAPYPSRPASIDACPRAAIGRLSPSKRTRTSPPVRSRSGSSPGKRGSRSAPGGRRSARPALANHVSPMASVADVPAPAALTARIRRARAWTTPRALAGSAGTASRASTASSRGATSAGWLAPATGSLRNMQPASAVAVRGAATRPPRTARRPGARDSGASVTSHHGGHCRASPSGRRSGVSTRARNAGRPAGGGTRETRP